MEPQIPEGCENCPNRITRAKSDRLLGKISGYGFAMFLTILVLIFSIERKSGEWQPKENPPYVVWAILIPVIGGALGVQIDTESVGRLMRSVMGVGSER